MANSTAAENFQVSVFRSLDAAAREASLRDARISALETALARAAGVAEGAGLTPERIRTIEEKVTRLDVRSGMIGAAGGLIAGVALQAAIRFLFAQHGAG